VCFAGGKALRIMSIEVMDATDIMGSGMEFESHEPLKERARLRG
jgi:hypothetical protein